MEELDPRKVWEERYARLLGEPTNLRRDPWLDGHTELLEAARGSLVLDLGCGKGADSMRLGELEVVVVALDCSPSALAIAWKCAPRARRVVADVRYGLPFRDGAFPVVVANLSLHYSRRAETFEVFREVRRCVADGGSLVARVNAFDDVHYGSQAPDVVEPECYLVRGLLKRFLGWDSLDELAADGWRSCYLRHKVTDYYGHRKAVFEFVLTKV